MQHEIGTAAGAVWNYLKLNGGSSSVAQIRKGTKIKPPIIEWAVGWLARENVIEITSNKNSYVIALK